MKCNLSRRSACTLNVPVGAVSRACQATVPPSHLCQEAMMGNEVGGLLGGPMNPKQIATWSRILWLGKNSFLMSLTSPALVLHSLSTGKAMCDGHQALFPTVSTSHSNACITLGMFF